MIFNRQSAFKEPNKLTLEQRIEELEAKCCFLESQLNMTVETDPCFYRGWDNRPQIGLIRAINLILDHLGIVLYETPPISSQYIVRTKKAVAAERTTK